MQEITINQQVYPLHFGVGFLRELNKTVSVPVDGVPGVKNHVGVRYTVAKLIDGDVEALIDVLDLANKGQNPRYTRAMLDAFVEDEETDIEQLFEDVMGFLKTANATRQVVNKLLEAVENEASGKTASKASGKAAAKA